jgi:hypothetical protein
MWPPRCKRTRKNLSAYKHQDGSGSVIRVAPDMFEGMSSIPIPRSWDIFFVF